MSDVRLKKVGLSATLVVAVVIGAALRTGPEHSISAPPADPPTTAAYFATLPAAARFDAPMPKAPISLTEAEPPAVPAAEHMAGTDDPAAQTPGVEAEERSTPFSRAYDEEPTSRIVVSIDKRWLWLIAGGDTLLSAPVAVGMNQGFEFAGKQFYFSTPRGTRKVLRKEADPVWTVPEWHYYERARHQDLEVVHLTRDSRVDLSDGTVLVVRGDEVGRINHFGNFWPFTPGNEIIFDGKVFVPPLHTQQRRVPDALGPYKLDMGNGYLIHGTHIYNAESVGRAVSHGCVRMSNEDLERLYWMVEPGTTVVIR